MVSFVCFLHLWNVCVLCALPIASSVCSVGVLLSLPVQHKYKYWVVHWSVGRLYYVYFSQCFCKREKKTHHHSVCWTILLESNYTILCSNDGKLYEDCIQQEQFVNVNRDIKWRITFHSLVIQKRLIFHIFFYVHS